MNPVARQDIAVFTRNHGIHLKEAAGLCSKDPQTQVTFRAQKRWVAAAAALNRGLPVPVYIAVVGAPLTIEYVAELCDLQLGPHRGDPTTDRLLTLSTPSTKEEGLWEKYNKSVETLYVLRRCRAMQTPFPASNLMKATDGQYLSQDFRYSYALVAPVPGLVI